jgi:hypothetical protein
MGADARITRLAIVSLAVAGLIGQTRDGNLNPVVDIGLGILSCFVLGFAFYLGLTIGGRR